MNEKLFKAIVEGFTALQPLQERSLSPVITETEIRKKPLIRLLNIEKANGNPFKFKRRTALPAAHFEGSSSSGNKGNSGWSDQSIQLKICRSWGQVDDFSEQVTPQEFRLFLSELAGSAAAVLYLLEASAINLQEQADFNNDGTVAGSTGGVTRAFTGLQYTTGVNEVAPANRGQAAVKNDFDGLLDQVMQQGGVEKDRLLWMMSTQMVTRLTSQMAVGTANDGVRYEIPYTDVWTGRGGIRLQMYRGVPLLESEDMRPLAAMGTITPAGATGGSLTGGTKYFYQLSALTNLGETLPSAEVNVTPSSSPAQGSVTITFTAFKYANSQAPYSDAVEYKLFRSTATGTEKFVGTYAALTYDADGKPNGAVTSITDQGNTAAISPTAILSGGSNAHQPYAGTATGVRDETMLLLNRHPTQGLSLPATYNERDESLDQSRLLMIKLLAITKATRDYLVQTFASLAIRRLAVAAYSRNVQSNS